MAKETKEMSYEEAQAQLSGIVEKLESGECDLDEMMRLYEKGMALYQLCDEKLASYEGKLKLLMGKAEGSDA